MRRSWKRKNSILDSVALFSIILGCAIANILLVQTHFWINEKLFWITMQFMNYKVVVLNAWSTFWKLNVFASQLYSPRQYSLTMQTMNRPICIKFLKHKTPRFVLSRNTFTVLPHWYCLSTTPGLNRLVA